MGPCIRWLHANAVQLCLFWGAVGLIALLYSADTRLGLYRSPSNRLRYHAIPVAVSRLYHHWPNDYTASRNLAMQFHNQRRGMVDVLRESLHPPYPIGTGVYFWVADDRGLSDYVVAAFALFGPRLHSLSKFYCLLLAATVLTFFCSFWRRPAMLLLPVAFLAGWLVIVEVMRLPTGVSFRSWSWGTELCLGVEDCTLYESRMFDVLSLIAAMHLMVLIVGPRAPRMAWVAAVPQATLLLFLYHCRSSIGWQYLGLLIVAGLRMAGWMGCRLRGVVRPAWSDLARPALVAMLLAASIVGLRAYQQTFYHPEYFAERGPRTFWHNALMGLAHHPTLQEELPMARCDDRNAIDLVLARMFQKDPTLDPNVWNWAAALNSLGSHNEFDWVRYEATARDVYFDLWRERPAQMLGCYAVYKPLIIAKQIIFALRLIAARFVKGGAPELIPGAAILLGGLVLLYRRGRRDEDLRESIGTSMRALAAFLPFSLIPAVAFYPSVMTIACFSLCSFALTALATVRLAWRLKSQPETTPIDPIPLPHAA